MFILNLTMHPSSVEQLSDGVVDLPPKQLAKLKELLIFKELPSVDAVQERAEKIVNLAIDNQIAGEDRESPFPDAAMIGGAPYLMAPLHQELDKATIEPLYAFSVRESIEKTLPDGRVYKTNIFTHKGFVGL